MGLNYATKRRGIKRRDAYGVDNRGQQQQQAAPVPMAPQGFHTPNKPTTMRVPGGSVSARQAQAELALKTDMAKDASNLNWAKFRMEGQNQDFTQGMEREKMGMAKELQQFNMFKDNRQFDLDRYKTVNDVQQGWQKQNWAEMSGMMDRYNSGNLQEFMSQAQQGNVDYSLLGQNETEKQRVADQQTSMINAFAYGRGGSNSSQPQQADWGKALSDQNVQRSILSGVQSQFDQKGLWDDEEGVTEAGKVYLGDVQRFMVANPQATIDQAMAAVNETRGWKGTPETPGTPSAEDQLRQEAEARGGGTAPGQPPAAPGTEADGTQPAAAAANNPAVGPDGRIQLNYPVSPNAEKVGAQGNGAGGGVNPGLDGFWSLFGGGNQPPADTAPQPGAAPAAGQGAPAQQPKVPDQIYGGTDAQGQRENMVRFVDGPNGQVPVIERNPQYAQASQTAAEQPRTGLNAGPKPPSAEAPAAKADVDYEAEFKEVFPHTEPTAENVAGYQAMREGGRSKMQVRRQMEAPVREQLQAAGVSKEQMDIAVKWAMENGMPVEQVVSALSKSGVGTAPAGATASRPAQDQVQQLRNLGVPDSQMERAQSLLAKGMSLTRVLNALGLAPKGN